jgi:hypothetical protein
MLGYDVAVLLYGRYVEDLLLELGSSKQSGGCFSLDQSVEWNLVCQESGLIQ